MFAYFTATDEKVVVGVKAENSWDSQHHEITVTDKPDTILGLPRSELISVGDGELNITTSAEFEKSARSIAQLDLDTELRTGANIKATFFSRNNPDHINQFTVRAPPQIWVW